MRPLHPFLFLLSVLGMISILMYVFPKDGIPISSEAKITFISFDDLFSRDTVKYADISGIIGNTNTTDIDTTEVELTDSVAITDTIQIADSALAELAVKDTIIDTVRADAQILRSSIKPIEFPNDDPTCLFSFFESLKGASKDIVRVMHYGDSQIEGDRITGVIRKRLQKRFGGYGAGLVPAYDPNSFVSVLRLNHEGEWHRHTRYGLKDTLVKHARWGMMASFSRFSPIDKPETDTSIYRGVISMSKKSSYVRSLCRFEKMRVFCGNTTDTVSYQIFCNDSLYKTGTMDSSRRYYTISWTPDTICKQVSVAFEGKSSPDIYGISFEPLKGIVVDNIPLRGSSGYEFRRISRSQLSSQYKSLNAKLIILEFGVNVVPNVLEDYSFYEKGFYKQIMRLKELAPDASIIVIGLSDMSRKAGSYYESYPNIELIRDAQKNACFKANCAFWDMYKAMGGKNSMPSWVYAEPALAQKDFTHFNARGAKIIGEMFTNALMYEYQEFQKAFE